MREYRRCLTCVLGLLAALAAMVGQAVAAFPDKPITIIIAFPPGGTSTSSTKPIADYMSGVLGVPVNLDYKPGAGGNVASIAAVRAPADGHTLLFGHAGPLAINHHINKDSFFDPFNDLMPVNLSLSYPIVMAVQPSLGVATVQEFVAMARAHRQEIVFGSSGNGSVQHLTGEMFKRRAGINYLHVPLAGGGPLQRAFLQGELQVIFETGSNVMPNYAAGKMRPLAVMAAERLSVMPEVPTMAEAGFPDMLSEAWFGFLVPKGTPAEVIARLNEVVSQALKQPEVRTPLLALGTRIVDGGPAMFADYIRAEDRRLGVLVKEVGVKPD